MYEALDTPVSLSCYILLKYGEYEQLVTKEIDPVWYTHPERFFRDYQAVKLLSKYPYLETGLNPRLEAMKKFIEAEVRCKYTNEIFLRCPDEEELLLPPVVRRVLWHARRKISSILGDVPTYEELDFRFGPGAAYGVRKYTSVFHKLTAELECTDAMLPILGDFLAEFPGWIENDTVEVKLRNGSQLTFVPKDAKSERPICIEPLLNGLYQKGVGLYIRNRLKRFGINLDDQSINQDMARRAYAEGLATVDFSSASDTIAKGLVLDLLPIDWFEFLNVARCPRYEIEGHWYDFEKFTSMGNAYTFELETLIFYSLAAACCKELGIEYQTGVNLHVYGDDVILPSKAFDLFAEVSNHCGFLINRKKSYKTGLFYESCGHDYFAGRFVRPFFIKKDFQTVEDLYHAANSVLKCIQTYEGLFTEHTSYHDYDLVIDRLHDLFAWCISCIPRRLRLLVPEGQGDCGLYADFDIACPTKHRTWCGYVYRAARRVAIKYTPADGFPLAYALYFADVRQYDHLGFIVSCGGAGDGYVIRDHTRLRIGREFLFGPWPELAVKWRERAIRLVKPSGKTS